VAADEASQVAVAAETVGVGNIGTVTGGTFILNFYATAPPPKPTTTLSAIPPCPYKGLAFFGPADAYRLFGRDAAIGRLEQAVAGQNFTALVGASGSGKSSVVLAGLAPRLHASGGWKVTYFRIGAETNKDPFLALARALTPLMGQQGLALEEKQRLADGFASGRIALATALGECRTTNPGQRVLLIADQFEEAFTLIADADARGRFIDLLLAGFQRTKPGRPDVALVLTLRADFYEKALLHRGLAEALQERVVNLGPMTREELREAIESPAKPVTFEKGLVDTLLDEVDKQPGALPLLQFALTEMWGRLEAAQMTYAAYEAIGGVKGALRRRAEDVYARLTDGGKNSAAVAQFRALFTRLVTFGEGAADTRRAAEHSELGPEVWGLAQRLAGEDSRLVVVAAPTPGKETVEIAHEALIANWPALRGAVDANREFGAWLKQLRVFLAEHRKAPDDEGALLRGGPLAVALDWRAKRGAELSEEERAFVRRSEQVRDAALAAEAAQRQRARRVTRWIVAGSVVAAIAMMGLAGTAFWQRQEAERQRATALANAKEALSQKFSADAARQQAESAKGIAEAKEREAVEDKAAAEAARSEAEQEKRTAEANAKEADRQKTAAERTLRLATEAANGLVLNLAMQFKGAAGVPVALIKDVLDRARDLQQKLIDSGQTGPDLLRSEALALEGMSLTLSTQGDTNGALDSARKAADIFASLSKQAPDNSDYHSGLWIADEGVGNLQFTRGQLAAALDAFRASLDIIRRLANSSPEDLVFQQALAIANQRIGDVQVAQGQVAAAMESYRAALAIAEHVTKSEPANPVWRQFLASAHQKVGDVQVGQGQLAAALESFNSEFAIMDGLVKSNPSRTDWRQDFSVANERIGDVQVAEGKLTAALSSYQLEFQILDSLAKSDAGNSEWQRALSVSDQKVGNVYLAQGQLAPAMDSYKASLAIMERLANSDPSNAGWRQDLAFSYDKIGDVQQAQKNLSAAVASYQAEFDILDGLAKSDPENAGWQRALSVSHNKVGDGLVAQGQLAAALTSYQASLDIIRRLAASYPSNAGWQLDLAFAYEKIGDAQRAQGDFAAALASYQAWLDVVGRLAKSDPDKTDWQQDLAFSYETIGDLEQTRKNLSDALASYEAELQIVDRLAKSDSEDADWQRDLSVSYNKVGDVQFAQGDFAAALGSYRSSLDIIRRLANSDAGNTGWQGDVVLTEGRLATVYLQQNNAAQAHEALQAARDITVRLVALLPDNTQWKEYLARFDEQLATLKP
jgi:tetratricopeptide (TPR) repeat protein